MPKRIENVGCPYCGVCCDDLVVTVSDDGKKILEVENACAIGNQIYHHATDSERVKLTPSPSSRTAPTRRSPTTRLSTTRREYYYNARKPLIYGFGSTNCEGDGRSGQGRRESGCHTRQLRLHMPREFSSGHIRTTVTRVAPSGRSRTGRTSSSTGVQTQPMPTRDTCPATRSSPVASSPARATRAARSSSLTPATPTLPGWRTSTSTVKQGYDYDLFDAFRTVVRGHEIPEEVAGIKREKIHEVAEIMKNARFGTIFYGMGLCHTDGRNHNIDIAISLTRDLNDFTKWTIMAMRGHYNITGPNQVWSWQYGFPYCLDLSKRDIAHMNPGETSSIDLAMRGEIDAFFNVATDAGAHFPIAAVKELRKHPWITIDPNICMASEISDLHIPVGIVGVEVPGIVYRMDNVPIQYRKVIDPPEGVISDEELFERIYQRLCDLEAEDAAKERAKTTPEGVPAED